MSSCRRASARPSGLFLAGALLLYGCDDQGVYEVPEQVEVVDQLDFGIPPIGHRVERGLVVRNTGGVSVVLDDWRIEERTSAGAFEVGVVDGVVVPAGGTHEIPVALTAEALGQVDARLDLSSSAGDLSVRLLARAVAPLVLEPSAIDFGDLLVGSAGVRMLSLQNVADLPVSAVAETIALGDASAPPFSALLDGTALADALGGRGRSLEPGEALQIEVAYAPATGGPHRGRMTFSACALPDCRATAMVAGYGRTTLDCAPDPLRFDALDPGETATATVTCTNTLTDAVEVTGWRLEGDGAAAFEVTSPAAALSLAPAESLRIAVSAAGRVQDIGRNLRATVRIELAELPSASVGIEAEIGKARVRSVPATLDLGLVGVDTEIRGGVQLVNDGFRDAVLRVPRVQDATDLRIIEAPSVIRAGSSETLVVAWAPTREGALDGSIIVPTDVAGTPELTIRVIGRSRLFGDCRYVLDSPRIDFGHAPLLQHRVGHAILRNVGPDDCLVRQPRVSNSSPAFEPLAPPTAFWILAPGEALVHRIEFVPESAGLHLGAFHLYVASPGHSDARIDLIGHGSSQVTLFGDTMLDFGLQPASCGTSTRSVTLYNPTDEPIVVDGMGLDPANSPVFTLLTEPPRVLAPEGRWIGHVRADLGAVDGAASAYLWIHEEGRMTNRHLQLIAEVGSREVVETLTPDPEPKLDVLLVMETQFDDPKDFRGAYAAWGPQLEVFRRSLDERGIDYRIGVTSLHYNIESHISGPWSDCRRVIDGNPPPDLWLGICGLLTVAPSGVAAIVTPSSLPSPRQALEDALPHAAINASHPRFITVSHRALEPHRIIAWNNGMRRRNANLLILGITPYRQLNYVQREDAFGTYQLFGTGQRSRLQVSGVGPHEAGACRPDDPAVFGYELNANPLFHAFIRRTAGHAYSYCHEADSFGAQLLVDGVPLVGHRRRYPIRQRAVPSSIEVRIDGQRVLATQGSNTVWTYQPDLPGVTFERGHTPTPNTALEFRYRPVCE